ncbi:MAG: hypothetical protein RL518_674 [Pseudomonadota bacterium]
MPYALVAVAVTILLALYPLKPGSFGTLDFVQYWSAWHLMLQGKSPYDPAPLSTLQATLTYSSVDVIYSWNPPWTFTLLAPVLAPSFMVSATIWCIFQVAALLFIAAKTPTALNIPGLRPISGILATLAFLPALYSIRFGQLGIYFALSITCFLLAVRHRRFLLAGLALLPLTAKPHLFVLCIIPGILWLTQIPRESSRRFLAGAIGGALLLAAITLAIEPRSFTWWIESMTTGVSASTGVVPYQNWMTHTTVTAIRLLAISTTGNNPSWPLFLVTTVAFVLTAIYFLWRRPRIEWSTILPPMLCLSLATSSYGWVFDQAVLLPCHYLLLAQASSRTGGIASRCVFLIAVSTQVISLLLTASSLMIFHFFFLLPWIYLVLLLVVGRNRDTSIGLSASQSH